MEPDSAQTHDVLEYRSPERKPLGGSVDWPSAAALFVGALSAVTATVNDRGGQSYRVQVAVGICGGALGLVLGTVALTRLVMARRFVVSDITAAAAALMCAGFAVYAGVRLYLR